MAKESKLITQLKRHINQGAKVLDLNLINTGTQGPRMLALLKDAGYTTKDEGCPQQTWTLHEDPEQKAIDAIEARIRDMYLNPDSYFEPDDPRRAW